MTSQRGEAPPPEFLRYLRGVAQEMVVEEIEQRPEADVAQAVDEAAKRLLPLWKEMEDDEVRTEAPSDSSSRADSTDSEAAGFWNERLKPASAWTAVATAIATLLAALLPLASNGSTWLLVSVGGALLVAMVGNLVRALVLRAEGAELELTRAVRASTDDRREEFRSRAALPELRAAIDRLRATRFSTERGTLHADGLRELVDPALEVDLDAQRQLARVTSELRSGSLGIAGPRGAGKTTLIRAAASGRVAVGGASPSVGLAVSAPVSYEPREFITYLFTQLCLTVLGDRVLQRRLADARDARRRTTAGAMAVLLALVGVLAGAYAVATNGSKDAVGASAFAVTAGVTIGAAVVLSALFPAVLRLRRTGAHRDQPEPIQMAWDSLDKLRYSETLTQEWSAELSAAAAKFGGKQGVSRATQALTMPELIDGYGALVTAIARSAPVFVGIDELDKMASAADVERFLNGIKSVLGQPRVFYLVSVSDDALRAFEQRGLPVRDAFESIFDDVLRVEPLTLDGTTEILRRRVTGLTMPFVALCHVLAGGLPRELIRCAREIAFEHQPDDSLAEVALRRITQRGMLREHAAEIVARRHVSADGSQPVLSWLRTLGQPRTLDDITARIRVTPLLWQVKGLKDRGPDPGQINALSLAVLELAASWYHGATVLEFFASLDEDSLNAATLGDPLGPDARRPAIDLLAQATLDLGIAPAVAWETVSRFRDRIGITPLEYPLVIDGLGADPPVSLEPPVP